MGTQTVHRTTGIEKKTDAKSTDFWKMVHKHGVMSESDRVLAIRKGFDMALAEAAKSAFEITTQTMSELLNLSTATYDRRRRDQKPLDIIASERLDRIISVARQAEQVFEDKKAASQWMTTSNKALGGDAPIEHCDTGIGARQVRRILNALEWGGVV